MSNVQCPRSLRLWTWDLGLCQAVRLITSQRKIFSQRMPLPVIRQEYAAQIRMAVENYSKQIVGFALVPVCCPPDRGHGRYVRIFFIQQNLQTQAVMLCRRKQVIIHFQARFLFRSTIKPAQISEKIEFVTGSSLQKLTGRHDVRARHDYCCFAERRRDFTHRIRLLTLQRRRDLRRRLRCDWL